MRFWLLTLALLVSSPLLAHGATFAKQSLFLSRTPVTEGETVLIHAVVANESNVKFAGEVVFKDSTKKIGSVAVSIAAGGANAVSISWKPTAGSHTVNAELTTSEGTVVESQSATFAIQEKPKPEAPAASSSSTAAVVESSADLQKKITDLYPPVSTVTVPIFGTLDTFRSTAADYLDNGINWAKEKTASKPGAVLGSATSSEESGSMLDTFWGVLATIALYVLTALRYVVGNAGVFYPVFALLFFYLLWRTFKRFRRPRYPQYQ